MLSFPKPITNIEAAKDYYEKDEITQEAGKWYGKGAEALGLQGVAWKEDFENVIEGKSPDGTRQLINAGAEGVHRVGLDLTYSASKSVSIMALVDDRIKEAMEKAVGRSLDHLEREYAKTRDQSGGRTKVVETGNLVIYRVNHLTSRELDPQLHMHCMVMNMTQREGGAWRSLHFDEFYKERFANANGMFFRLELMKELKALGYAIEITDRSKGLFEIKGVPKELIDEFSKRNEIIKAKAKELRATGRYAGKTDAEIMEIATKATRAFKDETITGEMLKADWEKTISAHGQTPDGLKAACFGETEKAAEFKNTNIQKSKYDCVREAAAAITSSEAVFTLERLMEQSEYLGMGRYDGKEIFEAIKELTADDPKVLQKEKDKVVVKIGRDAYSTRDMLRIEREIVTRVQKGKDSRGFLSAQSVEDFLNQKREAAGRGEGKSYTRGQEGAIRTISTNADLVTLIQGDAGTGKTTMLRAVKDLHEENGWQVIGMSNTGKASEELQKGSEIISHTVASVLQNFRTPHKDGLSPSFASEIKKGQTLWIVDEAGQLGSKDLNEIMQRADEYDAKLVLVGDRKQFLSVAAGKMFTLFQENASVKVAKMTEVRRQVTPHMIEVVKLISGAGQLVKKAMDDYENKSGVKIKNPDRVARKFVSLIESMSSMDTPDKLLRDNEEGALLKKKWNSMKKNPNYKGIFAELTGKDSPELADLPELGNRLLGDVREMADIDKAFDVLNNNSCIVEIEDREERLRNVGAAYLEADAAGKKALVITALNADRKELNNLIRECLVGQGKVATGKSFTVTASAGIDVTLLHYADSFRVRSSTDGTTEQGRTISLLEAITSVDGREIKSGAHGEVIARDILRNTITVAFEDKKGGHSVMEIDVSQYAEKLQVFTQDQINLAENDRVVFLKNDKKLGVQNGVCGTILKLDFHGNCTVRLDSEKADEARTIKFNLAGLDNKGGVAYNFVNHGYAVTEYKSQGQTVWEIIWHADTSARNTFNSFYVAITRAMANVKVFTTHLMDREEDGELTRGLISKVKDEQRKTSTQDHHAGKVHLKAPSKDTVQDIGVEVEA